MIVISVGRIGALSLTAPDHNLMETLHFLLFDG